MRRQRAFTLIELMITVAILGVLAAIAIPTLGRYVRRAKTTEPIQNIRKMYDASLVYFAFDRVSSSSSLPLPKQFPGSVGPTPTLGTCCVSPGGKCAPDPTYWQSASWTSLHFGVDDPFYFSYQYQSAGTDRTAAFKAVAFGDLNCDGTYSTFERRGSVDATLNVVGSPALIIGNDLE